VEKTSEDPMKALSQLHNPVTSSGTRVRGLEKTNGSSAAIIDVYSEER